MNSSGSQIFQVIQKKHCMCIKLYQTLSPHEGHSWESPGWTIQRFTLPKVNRSHSFCHSGHSLSTMPVDFFELHKSFKGGEEPEYLRAQLKEGKKKKALSLTVSSFDGQLSVRKCASANSPVGNTRIRCAELKDLCLVTIYPPKAG